MPNKHFICLVLVAVPIMAYVISHSPHTQLPNPEYKFRDQTRYFEIGICSTCLFLFGWLFLSKKGLILKGYMYEFYHGDGLKKKNNIFYSWLMLATAISILYFNVHLLNPDHKEAENIEDALRVWEITAYWVTTFYTGWFWTNKNRGVDIIKKLNDKNVETGVFLGLAVGLLFLFALIHTALFWMDASNPYIKRNAGWMSLSLIVFVYALFMIINHWIIKNTDKNTEVHREIKAMHSYIDRPTAVIFVVLLLFAGYARYIGCLAQMEGFFSGAIAFELILSSICWSNTNTF